MPPGTLRDDRFVIGGETQIALYDLAGVFPKIQHVTTRHDICDCVHLITFVLEGVF